MSQRQLGVITGEVGAGQTVAVRAALAGREPSRHQVIYVSVPPSGCAASNPRSSPPSAAPTFYSGVLASQTAGLLAGELDERARLPVAVIDEAHLLGDTELESLRMFTNTEMDTGSHLAMLLVAQPTLRRRLKLAVLAALDQRISTRYTITGTGPTDTRDYVRNHLKFAHRSDPLFSDDAITAIHQAARGYPRAVNNLGVAALIATYASEKTIVDVAARNLRSPRTANNATSPVTTTPSPR